MATREGKVKFGPFTLGHTKLIADEGEFELWNNLRTYFDKKKVIKALRLPSGVLPIGDRGCLIFGEGNFGKVRLAKKDNEFQAVKKTAWEEGKTLEEQSSYREYYFSKFLREKNIPNVMAVNGILDAEHPGKAHKIYQFMPLATLGDGHNLKTLLKNFSGEERKNVLVYTAANIFSAAAFMHQEKMYHRDIKASNLLINHDGNIYLSDFGCALIHHNGKRFQVSDRSDLRYFTPELIQFINSGTATPGIDYDSTLDSWRLGLTLLQLCGCIKEWKGILTPYNTLPPEALSDITEYYRNLVEEIKTTSSAKIPNELQGVIFGLLNVDPNQRLSPIEALDLLAKTTHIPIKSDMVRTFRSITKYQVPNAIRLGIKKAFKKQLFKAPLEELKKTYPIHSEVFRQKELEFKNNYKMATEELNTLLLNPSLRLHDLNQFIHRTIKNKKMTLDSAQFHALQAMARLQFLQKNESYNQIKNEFKPDTISKLHNDLSNIIKGLETNYLDLPNKVEDLQRLSKILREYHYFAFSYSYFYSTDKAFQTAMGKLKHLRKDFTKLITKVFNFLLNEMSYLLQQFAHLKETSLTSADLVAHLERINRLKEMFAPLFSEWEIAPSKIKKLQNLIDQAMLQKAQQQMAFKPDKKIEDIVELNSKAPSSSHRPFADYQSIPERTKELPASQEEPKEVIQIAVEGTALSYLKSLEKSRYERKKDYLSDKEKQSNAEFQFIHKHGYTHEEEILLTRMAEDYYTESNGPIYIKGNKKMAEFAAAYLHHKDESLQIYINGVRYPMRMIREFEKMIHEPAPHPHKESQTTYHTPRLSEDEGE